jgi:hypothetical protein
MYGDGVVGFAFGQTPLWCYSAWLSSGPHAVAPADFGVPLMDDSVELRHYLSLGANVPQVGDTYGLNVVYEDGVTCDLPVTVTGVWQDIPTLVAPVGIGSGSTVPVFSWSPPPPRPSSSRTKARSHRLRPMATSGAFQGPAR